MLSQAFLPVAQRIWMECVGRRADFAVADSAATSAGPGEEGHDRAGAAHFVAVIQVVAARIVKVDGALDQALAKQTVVEVDIGLRAAGDSCNVVNTANWLHYFTFPFIALNDTIRPFFGER